MDRLIFNNSMVLFSKTFGYSLDKDVFELYWNLFKETPDDRFKDICANILRNFKPTSQCPFPVPADFISNSGESDKDTAAAAIAKVKYAIFKVGRYQSVTFNDPALHLAIKIVGGWTNICNWTDEDWQLNERKFSDAYQAYQRRGEGEDGYLPGIAEIQNSAAGFDNIHSGQLMYVGAINGRLKYWPTPRTQLTQETKQVSGELESMGDIIKGIV